jgi:hypothetical protein
MNANNRIENLFYIVAAFALVCVLALAVTISGCGGENGGGGGAGGGGGGGGGGDTTTGCSMNPMTHEEIINACTDAQSVDIAPFFPASAPNGTLPALPN